MNKKLIALAVLSALFFFILNAFPLFKLKTGTQIQYDADTIRPVIPAMAKGFNGSNISKKAGPVNFTSSLDNDYYRTDSIDRYAFIYLETNVGSFFNEQAKRVPLNLSIVIDRSGSMSGEKMKYAKEAAIHVIDQLKPEDHVSIVIYDDAVQVVQPAIKVTNKQDLKQKVRSIFPGGATNLWGGTEKGYEQVKNNFRPDAINRVLLLSDGLANAGLTDQSAISMKVQHYKDQEGITLSTFGIGLDYNETLMTDMAETGAGNYYFIESPDKLSGIFNKEMNGLLNVAAQQTQLTLLLPKGVTIVKVYNYKYNSRANELSIAFRDLFSLENKGVLIYCRLDNAVSGNLSFISTLTFTSSIDQSRVKLVNENILKPMPDKHTYVLFFNEKVLQQAILQQANENFAKAMAETDKGNYEAARNINVANGHFLSKNAALVSKSEELKKMDSTNSHYAEQLVNAETMNNSDKQRMQKSSKEINYKIRSKKN